MFSTCYCTFCCRVFSILAPSCKLLLLFYSYGIYYALLIKLLDFLLSYYPCYEEDGICWSSMILLYANYGEFQLQMARGYQPTCSRCFSASSYRSCCCLCFSSLFLILSSSLLRTSAPNFFSILTSRSSSECDDSPSSELLLLSLIYFFLRLRFLLSFLSFFERFLSLTSSSSEIEADQLVLRLSFFGTAAQQEN